MIPQKLKNNGPAQEFEPWEMMMMMMMMMMMNSELRRNVAVAANMFVDVHLQVFDNLLDVT